MSRSSLLTRLAMLLAAAAVMATPAAAHAPSIGPNGGLRLHWGIYHVELTATVDKVHLYVSTAANEAPVDVSKARASGRVLINEKLLPLTFAPAGGNLLTASGSLRGDWKAQITLTLPDAPPATIQFSQAQRRDVASRTMRTKP